MTKRIFRSICFACFVVLLAAVLLLGQSLYGYFAKMQQDRLRTLTQIAAESAAAEGDLFFARWQNDDWRLTWIDADGTVLYDSERDAAQMENHASREEVQAALKEGFGESSRFSDTLMEYSLYSAAKLPDGTILRLSLRQSSIFALLGGVALPLAIIFVFAGFLSVFLAVRLSRRIVKPLNALDLEHPSQNSVYEELSPLLRRIESQQEQLKSQHEELQRRKNEWDILISGMEEGLLLVNREGALISVNPAALRILGAGISCVGQPAQSIMSRDELVTLLKDALAGRAGQRILTIGDGIYQADANPVKSEGGTAGAVLCLFDRSRQEKIDQLRREFSANVSHELKTPLHIISGCAELLSGGMVKPEDVSSFSDKIYTEAGRMIRLVDDVISLSHLDEGAGDMQREDVDLLTLCKTAVQDLQPAANALKVQLSVKGERAVLTGVPRLLYSIVYNLCDNAIKYNRPGGKVRITVQTEATQTILCVRDTGIGIPADQQTRIFERFYRVDKSRSKAVGGTGLGLSIVKHAALVHGARIDLKSKVNEGTEITVRFPR